MYDAAIETYRADLDPHQVRDCYVVSYRGSPNPKNEPRLHDPKDYPKAMVVLRVVFADDPKEQTCVFFVDKQ